MVVLIRTSWRNTSGRLWKERGCLEGMVKLTG